MRHWLTDPWNLAALTYATAVLGAYALDYARQIFRLLHRPNQQ